MWWQGIAVHEVADMVQDMSADELRATSSEMKAEISQASIRAQDKSLANDERRPAYHYLQRTAAKRKHVAAALARLEQDHKAERAAFVEDELANARRCLADGDTKAAVERLLNFIEKVWCE